MKIIFFIIGWVSFVLGIIGAFLPILPTTPFLILSAFLFSKSSPRFHQWILSLPVAGEGIRDWQTNRVIRLRAKILSTSMITLSLFLIHINSKINLFIKWPVSFILVGVGFFIVTRSSKI